MKIFIHTKHLYAKPIKLFLLLFIPLISFAQTEQQPLINSKLNGVVIDATTKQPIPGAVVKISGTTHAVATDEKGRFNFITGQKFPYTLVISFIGFKTQEFTAEDAAAVLSGESVDPLIRLS